MMYENTREGIIDEFTDKLCDEAKAHPPGVNAEWRENFERMQKHFIRGLVCDLVDRVAEDPEKFKYIDMEQEPEMLEHKRLEQDARDRETFGEMDGSDAMDVSVEDLYS